MKYAVCVVIISLFIVTSCFFIKQYAENLCEKKGGVFIKTATNYKCIDLKTIELEEIK